MSEHERPEVESPLCEGTGNATWADTCNDCNGTGYRPTTDDELADMAEAAWERAQEGEPPISLDEQHRRNWQIKRELKR